MSRSSRRRGRVATDSTLAARLSGPDLSFLDPRVSPYPSRYFGGLPEDRREFWPGTSPMDYRPARTLLGGQVRVIAPPRASQAPSRGSFSTFHPSPVLAFKAPRQVVVCVRRKQRREVLLALGRGGRNRPGRRTPFSGISCKG